MANLTDNAAVYPASIYELATTDPVQGGVGGVANTPHQQLADRTANLKADVDALKALPASPVSSVAGKTGAVTLVAADAGAEPANANIQTHIADAANPHGVTATQLGAAPVNSPTFTGVVTLPAIVESVSASPIDLANGTLFTDAGGGIVAIPAFAAGRSFTLECAAAPTGWSGGVVKWSGGTPPAPNVTGAVLFEFVASGLGNYWIGTMGPDNIV